MVYIASKYHLEICMGLTKLEIIKGFCQFPPIIRHKPRVQAPPTVPSLPELLSFPGSDDFAAFIQ